MPLVPSFLPLVLFTVLSLACGCSPEGGVASRAGAPAGVPLVRVRLLERQTAVNLAAVVPPLLQIGDETGYRQLRLPPNVSVPLTLTPTGWRIGATPLAPGTLTLTPVPQGSCSVNHAAYRGRYRFVPVSETEFDVVNDLDLDSYLKGVLAKEMLPKWDIEAYKAQAIVARTYALYEAKTAARGHHFDLNSDTRSQVYGGLSAETEKSRRAVDETAGVVVAYGPPGAERIFKAYFSACCGGVSASADALGDDPIPPLTARNRDSLCAASPHFNNPDLTLDKVELARRIRLWASRRDHPLQYMAALGRIDILSTNPYGRPARFVVTDVRGYRYSLRAEEMRHAINADATPGTTAFSSFFTPVNSQTAVTFTNSHGHGHGVGLCQYCAEALAERHTRHEDIVIFSYPQAKLVRAY